MVHGLEAEYWGRVDFVYLDREAADNQGVTQRYGIRAQPILILVEPDGTEVQRWFGFVTADQLRASIDGYLAAADQGE